VSGGTFERCAELQEHRFRQRIHALRPVQGDGHHAGFDGLFDQAIGLIVILF
jgi:hypothetical protein